MGTQPVEKGDGTLFLSGAHKGFFNLPERLRKDRNHHMWETYECPAGSVVFFTETLTHSGTQWKNDAHDRMAIFNSYNAIPCRYHYWDPHPDQLADMHPKRRFFSDTWPTSGTRWAWKCPTRSLPQGGVFSSEVSSVPQP
ncbi:MAG: hypothetical protein QF473_21920 [Planctomycetota bacterium]|jgi:ectoine hydroxylase-related dioxygenase (phytanoyl-CoA dioxygenase family)|nr:hypothetical protein [Planctomycetota bacterium]